MRKVKVSIRIALLLCLLALLALPLTAGADDDVVFASVRLYDGIDPADHSEIARLTAAGFLPIMRGSGGFVGYFLMPADDRLAAISLFDFTGAGGGVQPGCARLRGRKSGTAIAQSADSARRHGRAAGARGHDAEDARLALWQPARLCRL